MHAQKAQKRKSANKRLKLTVATKKKRAEVYDAVQLTMPYLKVPLMVWFPEFFKLIFQRQPSCSEKYVLNIEEN